MEQSTSNEKQLPAYNKLVELLFYGNYFYGFCTVVQSIEIPLQQKLPLNNQIYYFLMFVATVLYYNYPYARKYTDPGNNPRTAWYIRNHEWIKWSQVLFTAILITAAVFFLNNYSNEIKRMNYAHWLLLIIFPV